MLRTAPLAVPVTVEAEVQAGAEMEAGRRERGDREVARRAVAHRRVQHAAAQTPVHRVDVELGNERGVGLASPVGVFEAALELDALPVAEARGAGSRCAGRSACRRGAVIRIGDQMTVVATNVGTGAGAMSAIGTPTWYRTPHE